MSETASDPRDVRGSRLIATGVRALAPYWPVAAVLVVAAIVRSFIWLNSDVSWLLTLGEQVLAGAQAYVDFNEPDPPASFLIYVPAILLGRATGVPAEFAINFLVFVAAIVSLWMVGRILNGTELIERRAGATLFAAGCVLLLILPGDNFAEREHIALLAILPMLAAYARRAAGAPMSTVIATFAGVAGGVAVAIKPYFALAIIFPLIYAAWCLRKRRRELFALTFSPEHFAAVLVLLVFGVLVIWRFSDYISHAAPELLTLYVPLRYSLLQMMANFSVILISASTLLSLAIGTADYRGALIPTGSLGVLGFTGALVIQGKGWPYHGYPAVALSLLLLSVILIKHVPKIWNDAKQKLLLRASFTFVSVSMFISLYTFASIWFLQEPGHAQFRLVSEVSRLVPAHPKVISINGSPELVFPLIRKLHGSSMGRMPWQWVSAYADVLLTTGSLGTAQRQNTLEPAVRQKVEQYARLDRIQLADTIRTRHPDVILIAGKGQEKWAFSHPEIASALKSYNRVETFDGVEIWLPLSRKKLVSPR